MNEPTRENEDPTQAKDKDLAPSTGRKRLTMFPQIADVNGGEQAEDAEGESKEKAAAQGEHAQFGPRPGAMPKGGSDTGQPPREGRAVFRKGRGLWEDKREQLQDGVNDDRFGPTSSVCEPRPHPGHDLSDLHRVRHHS